MSARLIAVIRVDICRGKGTEADPCRRVIQYFSPDGELLAENDPCAGSVSRPSESGPQAPSVSTAKERDNG